MGQSIDESPFRSNKFEPRNLVLFFVIAFVWTWSLWLLFISGVLEMPADLGSPDVDLASLGPILVIIIAMPFGPTISAFIITWINSRREGVKALWKRFWSRRINLIWLLVIFLFYPAYYFIVRYSALFIAGQAQPPFSLLLEPWLIIPPFLASILHGGLSEEFGWRGYALTGLQARFSALNSSIVLGLIEGIWHMPLAFMPGLIGWEGQALVNFFFFWIAVSIVRTWIFNNTNGSVLAAVLFHAMGNTTIEFIPINIISFYLGDMGHLYLTLVMIPIAIAIVFVFGYKDLVRTPKQQHGTDHVSPS